MTPGMLKAFLIVLGLGLIALGLWMLLRERKKKALCTEQTAAALLRYDERTESEMEDGNVTYTTYYTPVFSYRVGGRAYTAASGFGVNRRRWKVGARVNIFYNPEDPEMIRAPGDFGNYFGFAMASILGLASLALGIAAAMGVLELNV